tara:strand:- start:31 stop:489 length:459 start_codon:yes stop_codon:yes gene_type:complete
MKKILFLIFLLTISCTNSKVVKNHGLPALELKANKIEINKTNKNDILDILGKPATISLFDDNIWYYIHREMVNQSFVKLGKTKLQKNTVLQINFNSYGIVDKKNIFHLEDMNDLKVSKNITSKTFQNKSYFGKLINSVKQKIDSPKLNRKRK